MVGLLKEIVCRFNFFFSGVVILLDVVILFPPTFRIGGNTILVVASQVTEMLEGNSIAPYKFIKCKVRL